MISDLVGYDFNWQSCAKWVWKLIFNNHTIYLWRHLWSNECDTSIQTVLLSNNATPIDAALYLHLVFCMGLSIQPSTRSGCINLWMVYRTTAELSINLQVISDAICYKLKSNNLTAQFALDKTSIDYWMIFVLGGRRSRPAELKLTT